MIRYARARSLCARAGRAIAVMAQALASANTIAFRTKMLRLFIESLLGALDQVPHAPETDAMTSLRKSSGLCAGHTDDGHESVGRYRSRTARRSYSAACLPCPSRALSFLISSSAALAITVPGGKIASAPALVRAS